MSKGKFYAGDFRLGYCAFCKHWYDPMNQAIRPKAPIVGFWEYDPLAENQCMVRNMKTRGVQSCNQFVCKI